MSALINRIANKIGDSIHSWRKKRQLRKEMAEAKRDLEFWSACVSPSGDPVVVAMIEEMRVGARSRITAA